jgi:hypothetical protein
MKSKSLQDIENKMNGMDETSMRYHVLESAKNFKLSWIELGRSLYTVWRDKMYKSWGYTEFDTFTAKEIGIKKPTAMKLLRSYYFIEKEEPQLLKNDNSLPRDVAVIPNYEAVDVLRIAKENKGLGEDDYQRIKKEVFEGGRDFREVKKDLTALIRQRDDLPPEEAWEKKRLASIKRCLGTLKSLKEELKVSKILPAQIINEIAALIAKIEKQID